MYNHLINFIDANKILYKYQFGFRKSHSTNHAIISLVEKVNNTMDSGKISIGVFLDLRKSFDTVDHCILLDKLYKYGIRGTPWNWFKSYLETGNNMYATVILYLQPCQLHMEYHRDPYYDRYYLSYILMIWLMYPKTYFPYYLLMTPLS